jgi:hypothetical protein
MNMTSFEKQYSISYQIHLILLLAWLVIYLSHRKHDLKSGDGIVLNLQEHSLNFYFKSTISGYHVQCS